MNRVKGDNKELKDQLKQQNDRINDLEEKYKDHEKRIVTRMLLCLTLIVETTTGDHKERIEFLEKKVNDSGTTFDYSRTIINNGVTIPNSGSQELEKELKYLAERVKGSQNSLDTIIKKRNEIVSTAPTVETADDEDDELRETLEQQLQQIKTRLSRVEDSNSTCLMNSEISYFLFRRTQGDI